MKRIVVIVVGIFALCHISSASLSAQEVLLPLRHAVASPSKTDTVLVLPFFDDFSSHNAFQMSYDSPLWEMKGAYVNAGYAPYPPTVGMATLDAFDAEGTLYATATQTLFFADTLLSRPIRLDSLFEPFPRAISEADSLYLSFYYLPGGGSGNLWERIGDCPDEYDSLLLEFYDAAADTWQLVWGRGGESVDSLLAHTGADWQFVSIPITDVRYFSSDFRFRFRNYCSLDNATKPGILSNADQWNIDYVLLDKDRRKDDRFSRDVAFVHPAPSFLRRYTAMPANQYTPSEMADSVAVLVTNLFSQQLATHYGYDVYADDGGIIHSYDGGFENTPVFWPAREYQSSPAHATPHVGFAFPVEGQPMSYSVVHHIREGVSGDPYTSNDTVVYRQVFDNYYAYDDGTPENGFGITSTASRSRLAVRFALNRADTLTALDLYFNRTYADGNASIKFRITLWGDHDGVPGNILYQDEDYRHPQFIGFNRYVRYPLENAVIVDGTVYVGLEQVGSDFLNLGFDRNNDASRHILYNTSGQWQTTILRGALMLRPYFGSRALLSIHDVDADTRLCHYHAYTIGDRIVVQGAQGATAILYDLMGRTLYRGVMPSQQATLAISLVPGVYILRIGHYNQKMIVR